MVAYGWGLDRNPAHYVYAAAVRSMSEDWHNFLFAAYDPQGFITVDKAPGALWVQALFVRLFGYETWAMLLPNVLAGAASVALVFVLVRRWAGPTAGAVASVLLTLTPIVVAADRVNLPDGLLVLSLVGAVATFWRALERGSLAWLLLTALVVAVGFHVKLSVALAILPVLGAVYLLCAPGGPARRLVHVLTAGLVTVAASSGWMLVVALTPAGRRPYVDGSTGDSVWQMVWGYNLFDRAGAERPSGGSAELPVLRDGQVIPLDQGGPGGVLRLFNEQVGGQISWLLPLALLLLVAGVVLSWRGAVRTDLHRAGWLVWGGWLLVYGLALSLSQDIHPYYTMVLAPPIAALVGAGTYWAWEAWPARGAGWTLPVGLLATGGWAVVLLGRAPDHVPWLRPVVGGAAVLAAAALLLRRRRVVGAGPVAAGLAAVALLGGPLAWVAPVFTPPTDPRTAMFQNFNPLAGPNPNAMTTGVDLGSLLADAAADADALPSSTVLAMMPGFPDPQLVQFLMAERDGERFMVATVGGTGASPYIRAGLDVMPLGGFAGTVPHPTRDGLADLVHRGEVRFVLFGGFSYASPTSLTRQEWILENCAPVSADRYTANPWMAMSSRLFDCRAEG